MRPIVTTYYGPGRGKPICKVTRGSNRAEIIPNLCRHMVANDYGATVAEVVDETTAELLAVVTYHIGARLQVVFQADVKQPVCVMQEH